MITRDFIWLIILLIDGNVVMLYNVTDGPCVESFGIAVASMAHFPQHVLREAKRKASELENITEEYHGDLI
jgi:DNA mismatch repair protein MSH2